MKVLINTQITRIIVVCLKARLHCKTELNLIVTADNGLGPNTI